MRLGLAEGATATKPASAAGLRVAIAPPFVRIGPLTATTPRGASATRGATPTAADIDMGATMAARDGASPVTKLVSSMERSSARIQSEPESCGAPPSTPPRRPKRPRWYVPSAGSFSRKRRSARTRMARLARRSSAASAAGAPHSSASSAITTSSPSSSSVGAATTYTASLSVGRERLSRSAMPESSVGREDISRRAGARRLDCGSTARPTAQRRGRGQTRDCLWTGVSHEVRGCTVGQRHAPTPTPDLFAASYSAQDVWAVAAPKVTSPAVTRRSLPVQALAGAAAAARDPERRARCPQCGRARGPRCSSSRASDELPAAEQLAPRGGGRAGRSGRCCGLQRSPAADAAGRERRRTLVESVPLGHVRALMAADDRRESRRASSCCGRRARGWFFGRARSSRADAARGHWRHRRRGSRADRGGRWRCCKSTTRLSLY